MSTERRIGNSGWTHYEVEMCACGHEAPIQFVIHDDDGNVACPNCMHEYMNEKLVIATKFKYYALLVAVIAIVTIGALVIISK